MMRILVAEPLAEAALALLRSRHEVNLAPDLPREAFLAALPDYDALVVRSQVRVDGAAICAGSRLVAIGRAGTGVDNIDLEAATRAGIVVVNAPAGATIAAAEHTLALLLALARHVAGADASLRRGEWKRSAFTGVELSGRTLGIVGLGRIGSAVADRAHGLHMEVAASDPFVSSDAAAQHGVRLCTLDELLAAADVLTLHVPDVANTRRLIGAEQLARMKRTAFLINVSRGSVVDEEALAQALREGRIAGAGLDVYAAEPPNGSAILDAPNTVLTPHLGASTNEAQARAGVEVAEQLLEVLDGRPAPHAVNALALSRQPSRPTSSGRPAMRPGPDDPRADQSTGGPSANSDEQAPPPSRPASLAEPVVAGGPIPAGLTATIVLVRHGESTWVAEGRVQGAADPPLSALGRQQAVLAGARLADPGAAPPLPVPPGRPLGCWHSPLRRAAQTARPISRGWRPALPLHPDPRLREIGQGQWEGLSGIQLADRYRTLRDGWRRDPVHVHAPGGEDLRDVDARARAFAGDLLAQCAHSEDGAPWAIVVAHEGLIRVLLLALLDLPLAAFWRLPLGLAAISVVEIREGRPALRAHNLQSHLAALAATSSMQAASDRGGAL
jgi:phosphoglycerate dehydrogenase-like enzyme/broad specificity phosphatase PhoE